MDKRICVIGYEKLGQRLPPEISFFKFDDIFIEVGGISGIFSSDGQDLRKFEIFLLFPRRNEIEFAMNIAYFLESNGKTVFPTFNGLFKILFPAALSREIPVRKVLISKMASLEDILQTFSLPFFAVADGKVIKIESLENLEDVKKLFPARKVLEAFEDPQTLKIVFVSPARVVVARKGEAMEDKEAKEIAKRVSEEVKAPFVMVFLSEDNLVLDISLKINLQLLENLGISFADVFKRSLEILKGGLKK